MSGTNQIALRNAFKNVKAIYAQNGRTPIVTPSDLRLENPIQQNVNFYQFYALQSESNPLFANGTSNTELRLNTNDSFWSVLGGLYLGDPSAAADAEYQLYSYPNTTAFAAAAPAYEMFFNNSTFDISINNVQYIQKFLTSRFRNVPQTQAGNGFGVNDGTTPLVTSTVQDQFDGNESGMTALGSLVEISGQRKIDIKMNVPTGLSVAPNTADRLVFVIRGFLALNAATR
jgi:hypothetical protein